MKQTQAGIRNLHDVTKPIHFGLLYLDLSCKERETDGEQNELVKNICELYYSAFLHN